ncbi:MAG: DUF368 domain-containing protein [Anaerolineae bacterium]|jgi:putative membrane protein|nr:DUF368 domain-containing protein [Chloroflexota bacterium]
MRFLVLVLKGMLYGTTHVVPGIGGGIVLLLLGVYEEFVESLGNLFVRRDRWRQYLRFLIPLGIGMVLGIIAAAVLIESLIEKYPVPSMFFFIGLLLGTIPSVLKLHKDMRLTPRRAAAFLVGAAIVVLMRLAGPLLAGTERASYTLTNAREVAYNALVSFLAGGASVTPGLDGSYVLMLGGTYPAVLQAVANVRHLVFNWPALLSTAVCAGLGILVFAKLIDALIKRQPSAAYYGVLGLVAGSIYGLWPNEPIRGNPLVLALALVVGVAAAYLIGTKSAQPTTDGAADRSVPY